MYSLRISQVICVRGYTYHRDTHISLRQVQFSRKFAAEAKGETQHTTAILEGVHISLVICVSPPGIRISQVICVQGYTHYTYITHILLSQRQFTTYFAAELKGIHITRQLFWKGVHISLVICVSPMHITSDMCTGIHISRGYIYYCHNASSLSNSLQSSRGIHITWQPYWKGVHISLVICVSPTHITSDMCTGVHI